MTASSEPTSTPPYVGASAYMADLAKPRTTLTPTAGQTNYTMAKRVPTWLAITTHVLVSLASLCVVATTIATVFAALTLGHALSQVGDRLDTPTPEVSCDPTYFNC